jgi:HEAT repeat protein
MRRRICATLALALWASAASGQDVSGINEALFAARARGLDLGNDQATRLEALRWIEHHHRTPGARRALPALERLARAAPEPEQRQRAVRTLGFIELGLKAPCPLVVLDGLFDRGGDVRFEAAVVAGLFRHFATGAAEVLLRGVKEDDPWLRGTCVSFLGRLAGKDPKLLAVIEAAKQDPALDVRDLAHCVAFVATDKLEPYLVYLIRLREDPEAVLAPVPDDPKARDEECRLRNLLHIGTVMRFGAWAEERTDEFARVLLKLLRDEAPLIRRGAANVIADSAVKRPPPAKPFRPWDLKEGDPFPSAIAPYITGDDTKQKKDMRPKERPEKSAVARRLQELKGVEVLRALADRDPDPGVREAAGRALQRLASLDERKR